MPITAVEPDTLPVAPFLQGAIAPAGRTLYIGGQNGVDEHNQLPPDLASQAAQAAQNVLAVLHAAGGDLTDVAKLTIYLVGDADVRAAYGAAAAVWGGFRTTVTVIRVAGLARGDALIEIDGVAALL